MLEDPTSAILNGTSADAQEWVSVATQPLDLSEVWLQLHE